MQEMQDEKQYNAPITKTKDGARRPRCEMSAADLESLAERLMLGEYTTADLHAAARCARGWAKVETSPNPSIDRWEWPQGNKWYYRTSSRNTGTGDTALEAVEAAEMGK